MIVKGAAMSREPAGLLEQLETSFRLHTTGPSPLSIHGRTIGHGLPDRPIGYDELRRWLLDAATTQPARDAALRVLIARARAERGAALIGLVGILQPGLRVALAPLLRAYPRQAADLEAETLTGLLTAISTIPLTQTGLANRLIRRAIRAGQRLLGRLTAHHAQETPVGLPAGTPTPQSHPELVLQDAVAAKVISTRDAELIAATRLNGVTVRELAARWEVGDAALGKRRQRAEARLRAWLTQSRMSENRG
jgi:hypothetical protein